MTSDGEAVDSFTLLAGVSVVIEDWDEAPLRFLGLTIVRLLPVDFVGLTERRPRVVRVEVGVGGARTCGGAVKNLGGGAMR